MTTVAATGRPEAKRKVGLLDRAQNLIYKLFFAHLGKFQIAAVYYITTQWLHGQNVKVGSIRFRLWNVKYTWDHALTKSIADGGIVALVPQTTWTPMRHVVFRGLLEGVLGTVLFNQFGFNVERYRAKLAKKKRGPIDNLVLRTRIFASPYQDGPVTPLQYVFFPILLVLLTVFLGVPLYLGLHYGLVDASHWGWLEPTLGAHQSIWQKLYVGDYDGLLIGVVVGIVARRAYSAYLYANTMNWARSWVAKGRGPRLWIPVYTRDLVRDLEAEGVARQREVLARRGNVRALAIAAGVLFVALAGYGFYVIAAFSH